MEQIDSLMSSTEVANESVNTTEQVIYEPISKMNFENPDPNVQYLSDDKYNEIMSSQQQQTTTQVDTQDDQVQNDTSNQFDIDKFVSEKTNGKFSKWDEIVSGLDKQPELKFHNDVSKSVYEMITEGKMEELGMFFEQQRILSNIDNMTAEQAIKLKMRIDDPELTDEDINDDFSIKFNEPDYDMLTEQEAAKAKRRFERQLSSESKEAKKFLEGLKSELKLPEIKREQQQGLSPDDLTKEYDELSTSISTSVKDALNNMSKLTFSIEDKQQGVALNHEYVIGDTDKTQLEARVKDYFADFESRYRQGDRYNGEKLAKDMFIIDNIDKIVRSAAMNAYNQGKLDKAVKTANANFSPDPQPSRVSDDETRQQLKQFFNY